MSIEQNRLIKITSGIAGAVAVAITLALPLVYFMVSHGYLLGNLEAEAEINARNIAAIIDNNPQLWRYETMRLEELLSRRPRTGQAEARRIYDTNHELVAESVDRLSAPLVSRSYPLKEGETEIGQIEITRSLRPLLLRTALVAVVGLTLGIAVFISLIKLPKTALSELQRAEERLKRYADNLQEVNEELKNFAYIISHDLRAPLVNIKGFSGELQACLQELSEIKGRGECRFEGNDGKRVIEIMETDVPEAIEFINSSVSRMDNLIGLVLKLSRIGHRELNPEPVDLNEVVAGILKTLTHQLEQKSAEVVVATLPELVQDRVALEQVIGNLLDNAVKYLAPQRPGRLEVWVDRKPGEYIFNVRDNGRGISLEDQNKVFEIFRRAGKQDVQGEGMGLAYVKTLVRRLGGHIWCVSEYGAGSTFSFSLPVMDDAAGRG